MVGSRQRCRLNPSMSTSSSLAMSGTSLYEAVLRDVLGQQASQLRELHSSENTYLATFDTVSSSLAMFNTFTNVAGSVNSSNNVKVEVDSDEDTTPSESEYSSSTDTHRNDVVKWEDVLANVRQHEEHDQR
uniref:Ethylene-responsive transcription factor ESR1 n=1 Tax=Lygus hesperus TaxID=30085 RepID=A0A0A9ZB25_LYGHE